MSDIARQIVVEKYGGAIALRGCLKNIGRIEFATTQSKVHLRGLIQNQGFNPLRWVLSM
ncbi:hypothetical protein [Nostoc sp.]|uniref:hypothetical protein n=1 Tax=Nostoc sp. TaxID=1180 RepID=UPI002FF79BED